MVDHISYTQHRASLIQSSWHRCQDQYGLSKGALNKVVRLTNSELQSYREAAFDILGAGTKIIESVRHLAREGEYCVLISDEQGVAVEGFADSPESSECARHGLLEGSVWHEPDVGTNGIGTCLRSRQSISICGADHYSINFKKFTCSAAPIYNEKNAIIGVLDISRLTTEDFIESFFTYSFIVEAANQISANIFLSHNQDKNILTFSSNSLVNIYESKAMLAFDDNGIITHATQDCFHLLEDMDDKNLIGQKLSDVIPFSFDQISTCSGNPLKVNTGIFKGNYISNLRTRHSLGHNHFIKAPPKTMRPKLKLSITNTKLDRFAGSDKAMQKIIKIGRKFIDQDIPLLLLGETGVGKDTFSRYLHAESQRSSKPYIAVNCAAIPETLMDSELFGYKPGTFTDGLKEGKKGKILASHQGTLFLDEIGDMPLHLQARLLRVLEEREVTPLGAVDPIKVDLKVICATHKNIFELVQKGDFRQDLLFRIMGAQIELPALKERTNIMEIINNILDNQYEKDSSNVVFTDEVISLFENYPWPGNIRELKSAILYASCLSEEGVISINHLPNHLVTFNTLGYTSFEKSTFPSSADYALPLSSSSLFEAQDTAEATHINKFLQENNWNITKTAKKLGISRSTLHRRIDKYNLSNQSKPKLAN